MHIVVLVMLVVLVECKTGLPLFNTYFIAYMCATEIHHNVTSLFHTISIAYIFMMAKAL